MKVNTKLLLEFKRAYQGNSQDSSLLFWPGGGGDSLKR